ncbi:hypothetical protein ACS0TY_012535 [Phlomoides rotata]
MATISKLLQTLSFITLFLMLANQLVHSQDVTSFTFNTFSPSTPDLTYQGGAHVPQDSSFLRLTETDSSGLPNSWTAGRVVYSKPINFWERSSNRQATFETTINFLITPSQNGAADGLAFFIAPVGTTIPSGATGANLGIFGSTGTSSRLFAVEFDNFINGAWDPSYRHIGIDIESRNSKNTTRFDSATGQLVSARINYDANTKTISVVATSGSQTASLSYVFDLKTILTEQVQVGISSATGQSVSALAVHDVISWYFTSTLVYTSVNNVEKAHIRKYGGMF